MEELSEKTIRVTDPGTIYVEKLNPLQEISKTLKRIEVVLINLQRQNLWAASGGRVPLELMSEESSAESHAGSE